jgi:glycosidase
VRLAESATLIVPEVFMSIRVLALLAGTVLAASPVLGQATTNPATSNKPQTTLKDRSSDRLDNWWNETVFYQVFVRSFKDSASGPLANDGIGDFQGLIDSLDYLNDGKPETTTDLGITGLWLMPVFEGPSYHGYETSDYYKIESEHGTNEDFKRFMAECDKRGIKVILDLVLNHTSKSHPWFKDAWDPKNPKHDWFIWSDTKPEWKGPWGQQVWFTPDGRNAGPFFYGIFSSYMPDLNYHNPDVTKEMNKVTEYWIKDYGVAGYRLDAIRHLIEDGQLQENSKATHQWLKDWHKFYKKVRPDAFTIGEVWSSTDVIAAYVPDQMDTCFEFDVSYATIDAVNNADKKRIGEALAKAWKAYPRNQFGSFLSNHDQTRVMTRFGNDFSKMKLAACMLFTQPGIPFLYYGEELGQVGDKPDENLRTPMQWNSEPTVGFTKGKPWRDAQPDYPSKNVVAQSADQDSLLNLYKKLVRLRTSNPALAKGDFTLAETSADGVYAFARGEGTQSMLIVANLSDKPVEGCRVKLGNGPFKKAAAPKELLHNATVTTEAPKLNGRGGFNDYTPITTLQPRTLYVLDLSAK